MRQGASLLAGIIAFSAMSASAGTMGLAAAPEPQNNWTLVSTVSAGPIWSRGDKTQTFYLGPETEKTYFSSKTSEALVEGDFFIGGQKLLSSKWQGQLGLLLTATGNAVFKGSIWDDADVTFNNYRYEYKVQHHAIALKGKLLLDKENTYLPWVSIGLGVGFNRAYDYENTPLIFEAVPNNNFVKEETTTFTYTLGLGFQKVLTQNWQLGVGYEFADWGRSQLGRAAGQTLNTGLKIEHIYTNGLLFNMTYLV